MYVSDAGVYRGQVHVDDVLTLGAVGLSDSVLHVADRIVDRDDVSQLEESSLQHGVGSSGAQTHLLGDGNGVTGVELDVVLGDVSLYLGRQMLFELFVAPDAVEQEEAARLNVLYHLISVEVGGVMAGYEVSLFYIICGLDRLVSESEVRDGHTARLLGVVLEVSLYLLVRMVADDLDAVLVGSHGTVGAQTPEFAGLGAFRSNVRVLRRSQRQMRHIVVDGNREFFLRRVAPQVLVNSEDVSRLRILGAEAVTAAHYESVSKVSASESSYHVQEERLACSARFLGPVEDRDLLNGLRHGGQKIFLRERPVEMHLDDADLLALASEVINDLFGGVADGTHGDDDLSRFRIAVIIERLVVGADLCIYLVHVLGHDVRSFQVSRVGCFSVLEEGLRLLRRTHAVRVVRMEYSVLEGLDGIPVDHLLELVVIPYLDLLVFVRGAEAVEEVQHRQPSGDSRQVRYRGQVHYLLYAV